jgi:hypothetical protein
MVRIRTGNDTLTGRFSCRRVVGSKKAPLHHERKTGWFLKFPEEDTIIEQQFG